MPSYATQRFNTEIRRRQEAGEEVSAFDPAAPINPLHNPASPAEFPATREAGAPIPYFIPRTPEEAAQYAEESEARHRGPDDGSNHSPSATGSEDDEEED